MFIDEIKKQLKSFILYFVLLSLLTLSVCGSIYLGKEIMKKNFYPQKYVELVKECSVKYQIDENLIYSIIKVESSFNKKAVSKKGAMGLMQITLNTANYIAKLKKVDFTEDDLFNENINIDFGCYYLRYLIDKFQYIESAICAYNAGETKVREWLGKKEYSLDGKTLNFIPYKETREYLNKINLTFSKYKNYY